MVALQILSDLHLETGEPKGYDIFDVTPKAPYLALLGDIGCVARDSDEYFAFLRRQLSQFKTVFLVLGNHEPYHSDWSEIKSLVRDFQQTVDFEKQNGKHLGTFVLLDKKRFDIHDGDNKVTVLGCTLFSHITPASRKRVGLGLNDFNVIDDWGINEHNASHQEDMEWLALQLRLLEGSGRKIVVLTHYSPTRDERANDPRHGNSLLSDGFVTDLLGSLPFRSNSIKLWAFGHTHYNCDFETDEGTRVYTNQRGYSHTQLPNPDRSFNKHAVVEENPGSPNVDDLAFMAQLWLYRPLHNAMGGIHIKDEQLDMGTANDYGDGI